MKPANVLVAMENGIEHAYLTDFGLAKRLGSGKSMSATGAIVGTVSYMAPEQASGASVDARTDVYALGCVFFEMLCGRVPFARDDQVAVIYAHLHDPPPSVSALRSDLDPAFDGVISKAMAKDPADRYLSAGDLARDGQAALDGARFSGPETTVATGAARFGSSPQAVVPDAPDPRPEAKSALSAAGEPAAKVLRRSPSRTIAPLLLLGIVVAGGVLAIPKLFGSKAHLPAATQVRLIQPWVHSLISSDFSVGRSETGTCLGASSSEGDGADPSATRCFASQIYDPCFANGDGSEVACPSKPWATDVTVLSLSKHVSPAPYVTKQTLTRGSPWGIQLGNGEQCVWLQGAGAPSVSGVRTSYQCEHGAVVGVPDSKHPAWTVDYLGARSSKTVSLPVRIAWY